MEEFVSHIQGSKESYNPSEMQGGVFFSKDTKEILLNGESYGNSVKADEEDITLEEGNLKLKDRSYDEANFSGKGYVILRKNILEITVPKFDLIISSGCTTNGTITVTLKGSHTQVEVTTDASTPEAVAQLIQAAIPESIIEGAIVTFTSNPTLDYSTTGVTGSVADNSYQENRNIFTLEMINNPNTVYEIRYDFDLNGLEITIPEGCILNFVGGKLSNGTLVFSEKPINVLTGEMFFLESTVLLKYTGKDNIIGRVLFDWYKNERISIEDYKTFFDKVNSSELDGKTLCDDSTYKVSTINNDIINNLPNDSIEIIFGSGIYPFGNAIVNKYNYSYRRFIGNGRGRTCLLFSDKGFVWKYYGFDTCIEDLCITSIRACISFEGSSKTAPSFNSFKTLHLISIKDNCIDYPIILDDGSENKSVPYANDYDDIMILPGEGKIGITTASSQAKCAYIRDYNKLFNKVGNVNRHYKAMFGSEKNNAGKLIILHCSLVYGTLCDYLIWYGSSYYFMIGAISLSECHIEANVPIVYIENGYNNQSLINLTFGPGVLLWNNSRNTPLVYGGRLKFSGISWSKLWTKCYNVLANNSNSVIYNLNKDDIILVLYPYCDLDKNQINISNYNSGDKSYPTAHVTIPNDGQSFGCANTANYDRTALKSDLVKLLNNLYDNGLQIYTIGINATLNFSGNSVYLDCSDYSLEVLDFMKGKVFNSSHINFLNPALTGNTNVKTYINREVKIPICNWTKFVLKIKDVYTYYHVILPFSSSFISGYALTFEKGFYNKVIVSKSLILSGLYIGKSLCNLSSNFNEYLVVDSGFNYTYFPYVERSSNKAYSVKQEPLEFGITNSNYFYKNGHVYLCVSSGTTAEIEPEYSTEFNSIITDGTAEFVCCGKPAKIAFSKGKCQNISKAPIIENDYYSIQDHAELYIEDVKRTVYAKVTGGSVKWVNEDGTAWDSKVYGTFDQKPSDDSIYLGFQYFCTDKISKDRTKGVMIYYKGDNVWVDANGVVVDDNYPPSNWILIE